MNGWMVCNEAYTQFNLTLYPGLVESKCSINIKFPMVWWPAGELKRN